MPLEQPFMRRRQKLAEEYKNRLNVEESVNIDSLKEALIYGIGASVFKDGKLQHLENFNDPGEIATCETCQKGFTDFGLKLHLKKSKCASKL